MNFDLSNNWKVIFYKQFIKKKCVVTIIDAIKKLGIFLVTFFFFNLIIDIILI